VRDLELLVERSHEHDVVVAALGVERAALGSLDGEADPKFIAP
jgi:hypothetical protein